MHRRDLDLIRKLCGLGLPAQTLAPALLPALRKLIPAHSAAVFWVDKRFEMTGLYAERMLPPEAMARYHESHYQESATGFPVAFGARAAASDPVSVRKFGKREQKSAYFRDVLSRLDAYQILYGVLHDETRPFGQISIYRGLRDPEFGRRDQTALRGILGSLSVGLRPLGSSADSESPAEIVEEWLGTAGIDGTLISAPPDWSRLVRLLAMEDVTPRTAHDERHTVREFLRELCGQLTNSQGVPISHIDTQRDSQWGRFRIRSYRLPDVAGRRADHVGVLIGRTEPRALALVRGTGASGLSVQQREVALLVTGGKSNQEVADTLSLTMNTVRYHVRHVLARLEVHSRNEVENALLKLAREGLDDQAQQAPSRTVAKR